MPANEFPWQTRRRKLFAQAPNNGIQVFPGDRPPGFLAERFADFGNSFPTDELILNPAARRDQQLKQDPRLTAELHLALTINQRFEASARPREHHDPLNSALGLQNQERLVEGVFYLDAGQNLANGGGVQQQSRLFDALGQLKGQIIQPFPHRVEAPGKALHFKLHFAQQPLEPFKRIFGHTSPRFRGSNRAPRTAQFSPQILADDKAPAHGINLLNH
ncbi:MAG TPA: hypothetical protein PKX23_02415 [Verrucomicrobiota bacterium]|nr:hypothetical protein [Verrucomicrobiota bacterium]